MPKVSVIIPVYNVEPYLRQCLDSIVNQTLEDIEIILVDDGSTDNSGEICDEYEAKDGRIRVIHKVNEGLSCGRNDGIAASTAPYIMFVDSDDWVEPDFCELPYDTVQANNADLVLFTINNISPNGMTAKVETHMQERILEKEEAIYYNCHVSKTAYVGFYHRSLFDGVKYPSGKYYEDIGTSHKLIQKAQKIYLLNKALYNHRVAREGSITTVPETRTHIDWREMNAARINDLFLWGYKEYAQLDAFSLLVRYGWRRADQKCVVDIVNQIQGNAPEDFSWRQKMMLRIYRLSPALFDAVCVVTGKRKE